MREAEPRLYAYAIAPASGPGAARAALEGIAGAAVRPVTRGGLSAFVSPLPDAIDDAFHNVERVQQMALEHHRVLQALVAGGTVLPLRFGTVFGSDADVAAALEGHHIELDQAIAHIDGALEWGLKIYCDRGTLHHALDLESPAIHAARAQSAGASPGHAFFLGRRADQMLADEAEARIDGCVADCRNALLPLVRAEAVLRPRPQAIASDREMVWNGAFLVMQANEDHFFDGLAALKRRHGRCGFALECTGPWPPASFADCRLE